MSFFICPFWATFVVLVLQSLLGLSVHLGASYSNCQLNCALIDLSCVKTLANIWIYTFLQQLLPTFCGLHMNFPLLLGLSPIRWCGSCPYAGHLGALLLFTWCIPTGMARWLLFWVTLAHYHNATMSRSSCNLLLLGHWLGMMPLLLVIPSSAVTLKVLVLDVYCLLLLVRDLSD